MLWCHLTLSLTVHLSDIGMRVLHDTLQQSFSVRVPILLMFIVSVISTIITVPMIAGRCTCILVWLVIVCWRCGQHIISRTAWQSSMAAMQRNDQAACDADMALTGAITSGYALPHIYSAAAGPWPLCPACDAHARKGSCLHMVGHAAVCQACCAC